MNTHLYIIQIYIRRAYWFPIHRTPVSDSYSAPICGHTHFIHTLCDQRPADRRSLHHKGGESKALQERALPTHTRLANRVSNTHCTKHRPEHLCCFCGDVYKSLVCRRRVFVARHRKKLHCCCIYIWTIYSIIECIVCAFNVCLSPTILLCVWNNRPSFGFAPPSCVDVAPTTGIILPGIRGGGAQFTHQFICVCVFKLELRRRSLTCIVIPGVRTTFAVVGVCHGLWIESAEWVCFHH